MPKFKFPPMRYAFAYYDCSGKLKDVHGFEFPIGCTEDGLDNSITTMKKNAPKGWTIAIFNLDGKKLGDLHSTIQGTNPKDLMDPIFTIIERMMDYMEIPVPDNLTDILDPKACI